MRKLLSLVACLVLLSLPISAHAQPSNVTLNWQPISTTAFPLCPTTGIKLICQTTDTIVDVTVPSTPVTLTSNLAATSSSFSVTMGPVNLYSTRSYNLTTQYYDGNGTAQVTGAATCGPSNTPPPCAVAGIKVTAPPPTGFSGTVN